MIENVGIDLFVYAQLCQNDTEYGDYYSLGTYTNFKWTVIELEPLKFNIHYDGGTSAYEDTAIRYVNTPAFTVSV